MYLPLRGVRKSPSRTREFQHVFLLSETPRKGGFPGTFFLGAVIFRRGDVQKREDPLSDN